MSPRTAEMVKLLENTYRHVNIALINELAILAHDLDIDIWEVVDAAGTKPFGFQKFPSGPGWGGHCIPVDPSYLSWRVRQTGGTARFVESAREINKRMPGYVVQRVADALNDVGRSLRGSAILVIGVAYKRDVADLRERRRSRSSIGWRRPGRPSATRIPSSRLSTRTAARWPLCR